MYKALLLTSLSALYILFAPMATASDRNGWSIGVGALYEDNTFIEQGDEVTPIPLIEYNWDRWHFSPLAISYKLFDSELSSTVSEAESAWHTEIHLFASPGFGERDEDDAAIFAGMDERENATVVGLEGTLFTPIGLVELSVGKEVNAGEGVVAEAAFMVPLVVTDQLRLMGAIGVDYGDEDHANYFYGVRRNEVRLGRGLYTVEDAVVDPFVGLNMLYSIDQHWSVLGNLRYSQLDDAIVDSTLTTDEDDQVNALIGIQYHF